VSRQIPLLIDASRFYGVQGNSFFRYEHIAKQLNVGMRYRFPALIPPMPWKDSVAPNPPTSFSMKNLIDGVFKLTWQKPLPARDGDVPAWYLVYRSPTQPVDVKHPRNFLRLLSGDATEFIDTIHHPAAPKYFYTVTALDRGNNESPPSEVESVMMPEIVELAKRFTRRNLLAEEYRQEQSDVLFIPYELQDTSLVWLTILDSTEADVMKVVDAVQPPGRYITAVDISKFSTRIFGYQLKTSTFVLRRQVR